MTTFCKLKDGREMVVFSDNLDGTMHVVDVADHDSGIEAEWYNPVRVTETEILRTDTNRAVAFA